MSQLSSTGLYDEESESADSGGTQDTEHSISQCNSSTTVVSSAKKTEKSLEGSTSLETAWTDSKHSSYLDFMEANFVQDMFARCYCMEDVCGGTAHNHHHHYHHHHHHHHHRDHDHHQYDCHTDFEESNYDSAESQLETLEYKIYDHDDWTSRPAPKKAKAPTGIPLVLLANPWVKHFRLRDAVSVASKTSTLPTRNDEIAKQDVRSLETASTVVNSLDQHQRTSNSITDFEKAKKTITPSGRIIHMKAKDSVLNASSNDILDRHASRNKRRVLWSFYKEVHRTRQKTGSYVRGGNTFHKDGAAPPNLILDHEYDEKVIQ